MLKKPTLSDSAPLYGLHIWSLGVLDKREPFNPTVSMCNMSSMTYLANGPGLTDAV